MHVCYYAKVCVVAFRRQKEGMDLLELDLQVIASHQMWVLGAELRSLQAFLTVSHLFCLSYPRFLSTTEDRLSLAFVYL